MSKGSSETATEAPGGRRTLSMASRDRASELRSAFLRINTSLDLDTVLQEVVGSARILTGAARGLIVMLDERGEVQDFVTSGLPGEVHREVLEWSDGERLFEHLRDTATPLRVADFPAYLRELGLSPSPCGSRTVLGTTVLHHRDGHLGSFFLGDKQDGGGFTHEDEETLVIFAGQATTAIANARSYRKAQRARADLEVLVDTSPVGVVVFDAKSGRIVSLNREARRFVTRLHTGGQGVDQLLGMVTWRHADGREFSTRDVSLVRLFEQAMPLRAEEIEVSVPEGGSVRMLINVTPIHCERGEVASIVVTAQDLAPLDELERQRAEFLEMVTHELRAPLTSIKGSAAAVLGAAPVPPPAELLQFFRIIEGQADRMRGLISNLLDAGSLRAGTLTVSPEPSEVATIVDEARNTFLSGGGRHPVAIDIPPDLPLAFADRQRIVQVLSNLFSNAARHAPQSSAIRVDAVREGDYIALSVSDEGPGIPAERLPHLFRKRVRPSESRDGTTMGRTGLGLMICRGLVEAHGGRIRAESGGIGIGARFTFTIPAVRGRPRATVSPRPADGAFADGGEKPRVLVVDDDPHTLRLVRDALRVAGFDAIVTGSPSGLSEIIRREDPHLVLLDLMLPGTDGIKLMREVPELGDIPVIFLSGYGRDETIATALASGAADYIVKPFSATELKARIAAALRLRARPRTFTLHDLSIDYERRRVTVAGRPLRLTATEYEVLRRLSLNAGRVLTYRFLLRHAWKRYPRRVDPKLVQSTMKRIRRKLDEDADSPLYIFNERGVGYRMPQPDDRHPSVSNPVQPAGPVDPPSRAAAFA